MLAAAEEFSFPVISSNAAVSLALLPPLWRISHDAEEGCTAVKWRRSFASQIIDMDEVEEPQQEKMDQLWEDFNEELQSSADSSDSEFSEETASATRHHDDFEQVLEECANVRQLKLVREKPKKKMESLVKVMKKLFTAHS